MSYTKQELKEVLQNLLKEHNISTVTQTLADISFERAYSIRPSDNTSARHWDSLTNDLDNCARMHMARTGERLDYEE